MGVTEWFSHGAIEHLVEFFARLSARFLITGGNVAVKIDEIT